MEPHNKQQNSTGINISNKNNNELKYGHQPTWHRHADMANLKKLGHGHMGTPR